MLPSSLWQGRKTLTPDRRAGSVTEGSVAATEEQQWFAVDRGRLLDLAEVDSVVASRVHRGELALDKSQRALQDCRAVGSGMVGDAFEFGAPAYRKAARDRFLVVGEDVHGEDFAFLEIGVALRLIVHRYQQQRRFE